MVTFQNWTKHFEMGLQLWSVTFSHYGRKCHNFGLFLIPLYISLSRNKQNKTRSGSTRFKFKHTDGGVPTPDAYASFQ